VNNKNRLLLTLLQIFALLLFDATVFGQETTGGLQGTVKDPSGAVISGADVSVIGNTMVGTKATKTDGSGYYRFANLPPGTYTIPPARKDSLLPGGRALFSKSATFHHWILLFKSADMKPSWRSGARLLSSI